MMAGFCLWARALCLLLALACVCGQTTNMSRPVFLCGGNLEADSGFIGSEGFPSFYRPDSKCTWYITVPEGNVVMLSFRIFDLEADPRCRYDYVDVYNGHSYTAQKLGRFCGTFRPGALMSTSNTMMVEMVSDSGTGGRGFVAYFNGGQPHVDEHQFCGGKITKPQGSIKTPNWPEKNYPAGISCSWYITVDPGMVIEVKFDKFDLEPDSYCRFDYVAFFDGGQKDDSRRIGKFCGDVVPQNIVTTGNELLIQFVSDLSVTSDGFMASYSSLQHGSIEASKKMETVATPRVESVPHKTNHPKPVQTEAPSTTTLNPTVTPKPAEKPLPVPEERVVATPKPVQPSRAFKPVKPPLPRGRNQTRPVVIKPPKINLPPNPLCALPCKREGTIQSNFCSSEFVITGTVTAMGPAPRGAIAVSVSLIKAYKAGRLTIIQAGQAMAVRLLSTCKNCPVLRRGTSYILMGQVDEDGRGMLLPNSFTVIYKAPQQKVLNNLLSRVC